MSYWSRWPVQKGNPNRHPSGRYTDEDGAAKSRQAQEFVNSLPDDPNKQGYKQSPIPAYGGTIGAVDRTQYTMGNVNTADLKTRQSFIDGNRVANFDPTKLPQDDTRHPLVVVTRDHQLVVDNGNHRVAHMLATGVKTTPARIVHEIHGHGEQGAGSVP